MATYSRTHGSWFESCTGYKFFALDVSFVRQRNVGLSHTPLQFPQIYFYFVGEFISNACVFFFDSPSSPSNLSMTFCIRPALKTDGGLCRFSTANNIFLIRADLQLLTQFYGCLKLSLVFQFLDFEKFIKLSRATSKVICRKIKR